VHENMQLVEGLQGNDGLRDDMGIKGRRVAHPRGEDVSEVLVCYSLGAYENQSNPLPIE